MYFLDPTKISGKLAQIDSEQADRGFYKPENADFHNSEKVIEVQNLLADILTDTAIKEKLTSAVAGIEGCSYKLQEKLIATDAKELAEIFISGTMTNDTMIFAPVPNLIFTRDVGTTVKKHILLNKPAKKARLSETLLMRYIFFNHPFFEDYKNNLLEIPDPTQHFLRPSDEPEFRTTLEGGDVMMVAPNHILIGVSERTSEEGVNEAIKLLFDNNVVEKVTVVKVPAKRDYMYLDTVFKLVKRDSWVILHSIAHSPVYDATELIHFLKQPEKLESTTAIQFHKNKP